MVNQVQSLGREELMEKTKQLQARDILPLPPPPSWHSLSMSVYEHETCFRHSAQSFISYFIPKSPDKAGIFITIFTIAKLRLKEVAYLAQGYRPGKMQSQDHLGSTEFLPCFAKLVLGFTKDQRHSLHNCTQFWEVEA